MIKYLVAENSYTFAGHCNGRSRNVRRFSRAPDFPRSLQRVLIQNLLIKCFALTGLSSSTPTFLGGNRPSSDICYLTNPGAAW